MQLPVVELECGQQVFVSFGIGLAPIEPSGNHEMDDEKQIVVEGENQAFAQSTGAGRCHTFEHRDWWVIGLEYRDALDPNLVDGLTDDVAFERFKIDDDIGILRHIRTVLSTPCPRHPLNRCRSSFVGGPT